jgi:hypothetical protein
MTQSAFAPPLDAPEVEEPAGASRRTALVAGGIAAAVALAGGGYFLVSGGSTTAPVANPVARHLNQGALAASGQKAASTVVPAVVKVPATSTVPLGRDPFHALYVAPVAAPAATAPTAPATNTSGTAGTSTPSTTTQAAAPKVYKLVLTGVSGSGSNLTATFNVAGKIMVAKVGSVFGPTSELKLLSLTQNAKGVWTATIQVGDSEPVDAPKGEALYVN